MEQAIEIYAALSLFGVSLSHLLQPHAWVEFFVWLRGKGRSGMFVEGLLCLGFGSLVVAFHNVWTGLPVVLTVIGWAQLLKGLIRLAVPQLALRIYQRVSPERAWEFQVAGVVGLGLSLLLAYTALRR